LHVLQGNADLAQPAHYGFMVHFLQESLLLFTKKIC
jgi:hypothetical protein